ncbi:hypothetical protein EYF80_062161 [Liparis tanakae]|uniref:Uncharacterized protein n=1 Tax=Liparis tanakae TaxID=230148 RepID=A0A4Z2EFZ1_9TELE|nr:hypothetical protein EYF80_062161 [Liparis tanakae]
MLIKVKCASSFRSSSVVARRPAAASVGAPQLFLRDPAALPPGPRSSSSGTPQLFFLDPAALPPGPRGSATRDGTF